MEITEQPCSSGTLLTLAGRFDAGTSEAIKQRLLACIKGPGVRLALDFSGVVYISSIGLRVLLEVAKKVAAARGKLVLCAMVSHVQQIFDLAGFASLMPLCATREEALLFLEK